MSDPRAMVKPPTHKGNPMPSLAVIMSLSVAGFAVVQDMDMPTIECAHNRLAKWSAPDWDSLDFYAHNYQLCKCPWH